MTSAVVVTAVQGGGGAYATTTVDLAAYCPRCGVMVRTRGGRLVDHELRSLVGEVPGEAIGRCEGSQSPADPSA